MQTPHKTEAPRKRGHRLSKTKVADDDGKDVQPDRFVGEMIVCELLAAVLCALSNRLPGVNIVSQSIACGASSNGR